MLAFQKIHGIFHIGLIFLLGHIAAAGSQTLTDMMIQTGTFLADIPWKDLLALSDGKEFMQCFHRLLCRQNIRKRAIILRLILLHSSGDKNTGKILLHRHLDVRIGLVILQKNIVIGMVFLDEVTFQQQCFHLGIRYDIFEFLDIRHHGLGFHRMVSAALKILPYAVFQIDSLPHIDHMSIGILHQIYPRFLGQFFQFFLYVKHKLTSDNKALLCCLCLQALLEAPSFPVL